MVNFKKHDVIVRGREVRLTHIEWLLLSELVQNAGRLMLYSELLARVWGPEYRDDVQILRTWISRLRYKIEKNPNQPSLIGNPDFEAFRERDFQGVRGPAVYGRLRLQR